MGLVAWLTAVGCADTSGSDNAFDRQGGTGGNTGDLGGRAGSSGDFGGAAGDSAGGRAGTGGKDDNRGGSTGNPGGAGSGGSSSGGNSGNGTGCSEADLLCEDFEDISEGDVPTGAGWSTRDSSCNMMNFSMGVTGDMPRGDSKKALKVTNHSYAQCRLSSSFESVDEFYVRAFILWDTDVDFANKETLAIDLLPDSGKGKDDPAVRFGNRSKDPCNGAPGPQITIIGLGGGEATGCNNMPPLPKGKWYCLEAHVQQSDKLIVSSKIDGKDLTYTSTGKPVVSQIESERTPSEKLNNIRLGFFTHNSTGKGDVYIDDVAVSTKPIGCGD